MRAFDKRKIVKNGWTRQMKAGLINNASNGSWRKNGDHDGSMAPNMVNGASHKKVS